MTAGGADSLAPLPVRKYAECVSCWGPSSVVVPTDATRLTAQELMVETARSDRAASVAQAKRMIRRIR